MSRLAIVLLVCLLSYAQSPLGTVTGVATDQSGGVVPNARITILNLDTGVQYEANTNAAGVYSFPNLPPGKYKVDARAAGFSPLASLPFLLPAFRTIREDFTFPVAGADTVATEVVAALIQTDTPQINSSLTTKQVLELPTTLRSIFNNSGDSGLLFTMMPMTTPGAVQVGAGAAWVTPGAGANGVKARVDGIETDFGNFGSPDTVSQPSVESVQEFTANIATSRAEFGGMATITTVTRSGANSLHGSVYWYPQNSAFNARNTFVAAKPFQNIENYGATVGGPIRKGKTFYFFTFDGTRGVRAYLFSPNVPTLAMRQGDFTGSAAVKDPLNGAPFANNQIPMNRLTNQALKAQQLLFPMPNFGPPTLTAGNYRAAFDGPEVHRIVETRVDHYFSPGHSIFARFQNKRDDYAIPGARSALPPSTVGTSQNTRRMNFYALGDSISLGPNKYNEFRAGVVILVSQSDADIKGQNLLDQIGIQGLPSRTGIKGVPNISVTGLSTVTQTLLNPVEDSHGEFADNFTWIVGRHSMKFGAGMVQWWVDRYLTTDPALFGNFSFTNKFSGNPYGDFLLGLPTSVTRVDPYPTQYNRFRDWAFYAQDDYKVTPRLTLNYGLRYEYNQPVTTRDGNMYSFDLKTGSIVIPSDASRRLFSPYFPTNLPIITASQLGDVGSALRRSDNNNFAPRFGFSLQADSTGKTVIRGGWGIYYAHYSGVIASFLATGPYSLSTTSTNNIVNGAPLFTFQNPFTAPGSSGTVNVSGISPSLSNSYAKQYSFSIERQLSADMGLRVSYIGTGGRQLPYERNANQPLASTLGFSQSRRPYPLFANITYGDNGANNSYNGLQVQVQKRLSHGLFFSSAWTWAKELSEVDDTGSAELNTLIENTYDRRRERGNVYSIPRHQWENQALYTLPGHGRILGGWQVNMLLNLQTGNFLNPVFSGPDPSGTNTTTGRPDYIRTLTYQQTLAAWYDRTSFAIPAAGQFGNAARNSVIGPGYILLDGGLQKSVRFKERFEVMATASFQNILNHVNYGQPLMTVNNANGGVITSTHIFPPAGSARTGLLGLRLNF
jgi:hypothetical protein